MSPISFASPIKVYYGSLPGSNYPLWPIVDIRLSHGEKIVPWTVSALVDSGASGSVIKPGLAKILGFDLDKEKTIRGEGVSGGYVGNELKESINVDIYGYKYSFKFGTVPNMIWECILGEDTLFQIAKLDFQRFRNFFEIRFREDVN